jgi:hypothetical protein
MLQNCFVVRKFPNLSDAVVILGIVVFQVRAEGGESLMNTTT